MRKEWACWRASHMAGVTGCSLCSHLPFWEKLRTKGVGTELCCLGGGVLWISETLLLTLFSVSTLEWFSPTRLLRPLHLYSCAPQGYSHLWAFVKISITAGGMRAENSYFTIFLTSFATVCFFILVFPYTLESLPYFIQPSSLYSFLLIRIWALHLLLLAGVESTSEARDIEGPNTI